MACIIILTCKNNNNIEEFGEYLQYTRKLGFDEAPDYDYMKGLFDKVLNELGEVDDGIYDWMLLNDGKGWEVIFYILFAINV